MRLIVIAAAALIAAQTQRLDFNPALLSRTLDSMGISLVRDGSATPVGQLWDSLAEVRAGGGRALRRFYRSHNRAFGEHAETTTVRLPDLSLVSSRTYSRQASDSIVAVRDSLKGWRETATGRAAISRPLPRGVMESSFFDALVRGAPLSPTYKVQQQAYLSVRDSVVTLAAHVSGSELVRQRDGSTSDTWVVEMDFAGLSSTMWIDKRTRALVRQIIRLNPSVQMLMER